MEVAKADNLMQHGAEIFSKPARTWFQSERQKQEVARAEKEGAGVTPAQRSKAEKQAEKLALKRKRGQEADNTNLKKKSKLMQVRLPWLPWQGHTFALMCGDSDTSHETQFRTSAPPIPGVVMPMHVQ